MSAAMQLSEAARVVGARLKGEDARFVGVATDSRRAVAGTLFVALVGQHHDGHDYVAAAGSAGAAGAMIHRPVAAPVPVLEVDDTRLALGRLGAHARRASSVALVGVTGSNGKTTVKEMIAAVLGRCGRVLASEGNLNNDIGVPLSLLRLEPSHQYAVIELGANHPGEIAVLTRLAAPDIAVITNAGPAHLEGFGDVAGVARAKGEIIEGLGEDGVAVINADDAHAGLWRRLAGARRTVTFGIDTAANVRPEGTGPDIRLHLPDGSVLPIRLPLPGRHNALNAAAAAAAAVALDVPAMALAGGLEGMRGVTGRLQRLNGRNGARVIDDTYNANPASLAAGLEVLATLEGERILVLGDMLELGAEAEALHARAGDQARVAGVDALWGTGELARAAVAAFGHGGRYFESPEALASALVAHAHPGLTVLAKGSRSARMDRVVHALTAGQPLADTGEG